MISLLHELNYIWVINYILGVTCITRTQVGNCTTKNFIHVKGLREKGEQQMSFIVHYYGYDSFSPSCSKWRCRKLMKTTMGLGRDKKST